MGYLVMKPYTKPQLLVSYKEGSSAKKRNRIVSNLEWFFRNSSTMQLLAKDCDETVVNKSVVRLNSVTGLYTMAKADTPENSLAEGIAINVAGGKCDVVTHGYIQDFSGVFAGTAYYLSATEAGALQSLPPRISRKIGMGVGTGFFVQKDGFAIFEHLPQSIYLSSQSVEGSVANFNALRWSTSNNRWEKCPTGKTPGALFCNGLVFLFGKIAGLSGLTPGATYCFSTSTDGVLTLDGESRIQIGKALSSTEFLLDIDDYGQRTLEEI